MKKPIELLYAEWAVNHLRILKEAMDRLSGNTNMMAVRAAIEKEIGVLVAEDENYELAEKVVFFDRL